MGTSEIGDKEEVFIFFISSLSLWGLNRKVFFKFLPKISLRAMEKEIQKTSISKFFFSNPPTLILDKK